MIIVAGSLQVEPARRAAYLDDCREAVRLARDAAGCLDFSLGADLLDDGRINVFERWASRPELDAFRGSGPSDDQQDAILGYSIQEHEVD